MGSGAFNLLKAGNIEPESAKQLKISLAEFPKILSNLFSQADAISLGWAFTARYR